MLDEQVVTAVATGNLKAISEQPALLSNLAYNNAVASNNLGQQNAVANQQAGNEMGLSLVANATNTISNLGPLASRSAVDVLTNNELAQTIADLKSAVQAFDPSNASGGVLKVGPFTLSLDGQGRLVIVPTRREDFEFVIPGGFTREQVEVRSDPNVGIRIRVRETR
ncbi:hypothetical protein [Dyella mobilis]|uniref:Uncharacterized protein n=1 Tax=Dyella mobilis TaxID=1849582 RepID=A0ABS2KJI1_9GAMM|nr:hypothetical protein [Dyella mobilis]MBM7131234.1 hypothetical protein [Dyella mobilis]GLQ98829.1 hypothetical protein GCM10007863_32490 [Dyella mobilis]